LSDDGAVAHIATAFLGNDHEFRRESTAIRKAR
jgi:hypothetical protein